MKKKSLFMPVLVVSMVIILAFSFIFASYSKINTSGGSANIGGEIMTDTTKSPQEYLEIINNYTLQNSQLKAELSSSQAEYDKKVAEYNKEILQLQTELNELTEEDTQLIAEKNARIETLKEYISVLEKEQAEKKSEYENEIEKLNNIISDYETKVLDTIKIPEGFVFTTLGFNVIDDNSFVFYSRSHSCNLYYYDFTTKITVTIPIKTTSFNGFYKTENLLFFSASDFLYVFDFSSQKITNLCVLKSYLTYVEDNDFVYMFDYCSGFATYNKSTKEFKNSLSSSSNYDFAVAYNLENYILFSGRVSSKKVILLFDKETNEFATLVDNLSYQATYFDIVNDELLCWATPNLYKIDIETKTATLVGEIPSNNSTLCTNFFDINNKLVCFTKSGVYCYSNNEIVNLGSRDLSSWNIHFTKITDNIYYLSRFTSAYNLSSPLYKIDLENSSFEVLISEDSDVWDYFEISDYEILLSYNKYYFINKTIGSIDSLTLSSSSSPVTKHIETVFCGDYVVFYTFIESDFSFSSSYIYFFDKVNNVYGRLSSGISQIVEVVYKNNLLYVLTKNRLYSLSFTDPTTYITNLAVEGTLSSLKHGIIYSNVGTLNGSNLYVKYILQADGTLVKSELVVI